MQKEPKLKFKVKLLYPNSHFKPDDILEQSERIPPGCVGKFIDDTTGWAWVENPLAYGDIFMPMMVEYLAEMAKWEKGSLEYGLACSYYTKTFPTIDELVDNILASGMDPNYEITLNGEPTGVMATDHIAY